MERAFVARTILATACLGPACTYSEPVRSDQNGLGTTGMVRTGSMRYGYGALEHDPERTDIPFPRGGRHALVARGAGQHFPLDAENTPGRLHPDLRGPGPDGAQLFDPEEIEGCTGRNCFVGADWEVFASSWWPQTSNGIAWRWHPRGFASAAAAADYSNYADPAVRKYLSPTEKYDLLFHGDEGSYSVPAVATCRYDDLLRRGRSCRPIREPAHRVAGKATQWELQNHGNYQPGYHPDRWWGYCNGWASYTTTEPGSYPRRDVVVRLNEDGGIEECKSEGESGCMYFFRADIEALMTSLYFSDSATFAGRRCYQDPEEIRWNERGEPVDRRTGQVLYECMDVNPAIYHAAITGLLARDQRPLSGNRRARRLPFVMDHNYGWEVWNFPVVGAELRYVSDVFDGLDEATRFVCGIDRESPVCAEYVPGPRARSFVYVETVYYTVAASASQEQLLRRADQRNVPPESSQLSYLLELDEDDHIVGGAWTTGRQRWSVSHHKLHPDFLWIGINHRGADEGPDDLGGSEDNPHIAYSKVRALLDLANR
jgi:hypothetical protein